MKMIEELCNKILVILKESSFTKKELIFINKYFKEIVKITDKMLEG